RDHRPRLRRRDPRHLGRRNLHAHYPGLSDGTDHHERYRECHPSRSRRCRGDPEPGVGPAMAPRTHAEEPTLVQPDTQPSSQSAIPPGDRLSTVLARDERLLDVLVAAAPTLETLRNASLRKNMTPRVTVEQAARIAGIEATDLV